MQALTAVHLWYPNSGDGAFKSITLMMIRRKMVMMMLYCEDGDDGHGGDNNESVKILKMM